jgi:crossover junction endodeoxyribonuclease RusA
VRITLTIPGKPVPLQRSRTSHGRHYLPTRSKAFREAVQTAWLLAGRPSLGSAPFAASMRFYGARANADVSNLVKSIEDALNGLAYDDDVQCVCIAGASRLPLDADGPRTVLELWPVEVVV